VTEALLGSTAVLLDVPRAEFVTLPSMSRLAFALQNGLPILADERINLAGTNFADYVEVTSLKKLLSNRKQFLGEKFRQKAEARAAEWRARYRMSALLKDALSVTPVDD
jgi:hypothetical protein